MHGGARSRCWWLWTWLDNSQIVSKLGQASRTVRPTRDGSIAGITLDEYRRPIFQMHPAPVLRVEEWAHKRFHPASLQSQSGAQSS